VIVPVFKTGGRLVIQSSVGSTPTRFRHSKGLRSAPQSIYSPLVDAPVAPILLPLVEQHPHETRVCLSVG
jgi:hypothetical protein